jgi:electron transport complex protein RnfB
MSDEAIAERGASSSSVAIARIDEAACIGCTLCVAACPVDAIVGAAKLMHTVLAERCTGCELCLPPCPVDCIAMLPGSRPGPPRTPSSRDRGRSRASCAWAPATRRDRSGQYRRERVPSIRRKRAVRRPSPRHSPEPARGGRADRPPRARARAGEGLDRGGRAIHRGRGTRRRIPRDRFPA